MGGEKKVKGTETEEGRCEMRGEEDYVKGDRKRQRKRKKS